MLPRNLHRLSLTLLCVINPCASIICRLRTLEAELLRSIIEGQLRLKIWRDTGVDTVRLYPAGDTLTARLDNLGRALDLIHALGPMPTSPPPVIDPPHR